MLTILVPAYNEEEVLRQFIEDVESKVDSPHELLIVNDGSKDDTRKIAEEAMREYPNVRLVNHEVNKGLGMALKTGFKEAKHEIIVTMDADMTHKAELVDAMSLLIHQNVCDVVLGSRYVDGGGMKDVPWHRVKISEFANWFYRTAFRTRIQDCTAGFKAYRASLVKKMELVRPGFVIQLEILTNVLNANARVVELPMVLESRKLGSSKAKFFKSLPRYGLEVMKLMKTRWIK